MEKPELTLQEIREKFGFRAKNLHNLPNPHLVITEPVIEIDAIAYDKRYPATIELYGDFDYTLESLQSLLKLVSLMCIKNGGLIGYSSEIITTPSGRQLLKVYERYASEKMTPEEQSAWELLYKKIFSVYHGDGTGVEPMILKSLYPGKINRITDGRVLAYVISSLRNLPIAVFQTPFDECE